AGLKYSVATLLCRRLRNRYNRGLDRGIRYRRTRSATTLYRRTARDSAWRPLLASPLPSSNWRKHILADRTPDLGLERPGHYEDSLRVRCGNGDVVLLWRADYLGAVYRHEC